MFLPSTSKQDEQKLAKETRRKEAYTRIEAWAKKKIPENLRDGVEINVKEVICGDPDCSPIDTAISIFFPSGGRGMFGVPFESKDVTEQDLSVCFPSPEVIEIWSSGRKQEDEKKQRAEAYKRIKAWAMQEIPENLQDGVIISVREVICGDPDCSPIDTAIAILFPSLGRGLIGIPLESRDVTQQVLSAFFPTPEVIEAWGRGEEADWPPIEDSEPELVLPPLRFQVGERVECRVGPDPVKGWASGIVKQLWYSESSWPKDSFAPYTVLLDDGITIYAPQDLDTIIRKEIAASSYSLWDGCSFLTNSRIA